MRITGFKTAPLRIGLKKPFITSLRRVDAIDDILIKIETDSSLVGYGEACAVTAITGTTNTTLLHELHTIIFPALIGQAVDGDKIFEVLYACDTSSEAKACVDIALYDLLAKEQGQALFRYLSGVSDTLVTDLTISVNEPCLMAQEAHSAVEQGFSHLKIKLDADLEKNIQRMNAINALIPSHIRLRIDPNQAFSFLDAVRFVREVRSDNIECLEQPFPPSKDEDMRRLKKESLVPILADESLFDAQDARRLLETSSADMLNIKLMKSGGIYEAIKIAEIARKYDKGCMIGSMLEGPVSLLAALHFGLSQKQITMADLDSPFYLDAHPLLKPFRINAETLSVGDDIGLGVDQIIQDLNLFPSA